MADFDFLAVGDGPAALSACLTARARGLTTLCLGTGEESPLARTERIDNYPGLPHVSGRELLAVFRRQALEAGVEMRTGLVRQVQPLGKELMVLAGADVLTARTVLLAMGAAKPKLLPGEEELLGQGVSWCGTCDGMFYRGKRVAVLSWLKSGAEEADFLAGLAGETDYYVMRPHDLPETRHWRLREETPLSLRRTEEGILLRTDRGGDTYDGVFLFHQAVAPEMLLRGLKTDGPFIQVDGEQRTGIPGVFAAGDCTGKPLQVAKAVGEGCRAAIAAARYLAEEKKE